MCIALDSVLRLETLVPALGFREGDAGGSRPPGVPRTLVHGLGLPGRFSGEAVGVLGFCGDPVGVEARTVSGEPGRESDRWKGERREELKERGDGLYGIVACVAAILVARNQ